MEVCQKIGPLRTAFWGHSGRWKPDFFNVPPLELCNVTLVQKTKDYQVRKNILGYL